MTRMLTRDLFAVVNLRVSHSYIYWLLHVANLLVSHGYIYCRLLHEAFDSLETCKP